MKVASPKVTVSSQIPRDQRRALERLAARSDRTLSTEIRIAVREYLEARPEDEEEKR
jgi:hypothetical protein